MLPEKQTNTNIGVGIGIVLQIGYRVLDSQGMPEIGIVVGLVGLAIFIWGCFNYAEGKGYPGVLGLLGILSCIGLFILVLLPDKYK